MSSALQASQHGPKVSAITATPGGIFTISPPAGMVSTAITPGMANTAARLLTRTTVPRNLDGIRRIVGTAPGTFRSIVNFFLPVTMSRASSLA